MMPRRQKISLHGNGRFAAADNRRGQGPKRRATDRRLVYERKIEIDPIITHVLSVQEINKGFDLMYAGKIIRSVVLF